MVIVPDLAHLGFKPDKRAFITIKPLAHSSERPGKIDAPGAHFYDAHTSLHKVRTTAEI